MARVKIDLPESWLFSIDIPVRITDINYGNHMGNDSFLSILHEARMRWIHQHGWTELNIEKTGLIMVDIAVRFKAEAVFGDVLRIDLAPLDWSNVGFELIYLASNKETGKEVARAQSGMIFFDYTSRRLTSMPAVFRQRVEMSQRG